jgi:hypothetical protein
MCREISITASESGSGEGSGPSGEASDNPTVKHRSEERSRVVGVTNVIGGKSFAMVSDSAVLRGGSG